MIKIHKDNELQDYRKRGNDLNLLFGIIEVSKFELPNFQIIGNYVSAITVFNMVRITNFGEIIEEIELDTNLITLTNGTYFSTLENITIQIEKDFYYFYISNGSSSWKSEPFKVVDIAINTIFASFDDSFDNSFQN